MRVRIRIAQGKTPSQVKKESEMPLINVRAKAGRVAYDAPRHGKLIPSDRFIPVQDSAHIRRLLNHFEDIELEPKAPAPAAKVTPPAPVAKDD